jgi:hypothetical protein
VREAIQTKFLPGVVIVLFIYIYLSLFVWVVVVGQSQLPLTLAAKNAGGRNRKSVFPKIYTFFATSPRRSRRIR